MQDPPSQRLMSPRSVIVALVGTAGVAVIYAIPTAIIDNPWFTRMTPVYADQYFYWIATSVLTGALIATYLGGGGPAGARAGLGGGALGYLAIGCPICNKLIVGLLGVSGAMNLFAPVQPVLGAAGVLLIGAALAYRVRDIRRGSCSLPAG